MKPHVALLCALHMALVAVIAHAALAAPVMPVQGRATIMLKNPVWLSGIKVDAEGSKLAAYAENFPAAVTTDHFVVVNAGFWLANQAKPTQAIYEFALTVKKHFQKRVYTRVLLDDPSDSTTPIKYEHYLDPAEGSTKATHGPLRDIKRGKRYTFTLEVYSDENRSQLLERVKQDIVSPLDNTSGCVELAPDVLLAAFPSLNPFALDKFTLACDR
jgi:hypothetical protein